MATTPETMGRSIIATFSGGLSTIGAVKCTAKTPPGIDEMPEVDASTDDALLTTRLIYYGLPKASNIVLTAEYDIEVFEIIKDLMLAHTPGILTFASSVSSKSVALAVCEVIGLKPGSVDNDGFPTMDITVGPRGGVTANEPIGG